MRAVLLDTGPIVALLDSSEASHRACANAVADLNAALVTTEAVIAESCYLLRRVANAADAVLENVASGVFRLPLPLSESAHDVRRIMRKYRDRNIDLADACLIHLAEQFHTGEILTLDRDFHVYRWGKNNSFENLIRLT